MSDPRTQEIERLRNALDRDQTGLAKALNRVRKVVEGYGWLADEDAWGSYSYEERTPETLRREIGWCLERIEGECIRALRESGDLATRVLRDGDSLPLSEEDQYLQLLHLRVVKLRAALRTRVIRPGTTIQGREIPSWCAQCDAIWAQGEPEQHVVGCLAAPVTESR